MLIDNKNFDVVEGLLTQKKLPQMNSIELAELVRIQELDVTGYTEADVRAEIIDPIIRILGYRKGDYSSVDREKHISFLGQKNKYIDYNMTLWKENFWIIEAKRPLRGDKFGYAELRQAIEYAIHPAINAAIVVICDGIKIEVFDREENVEAPIISFKISDLESNFDLLRMLLCPIHVWFFYKRRVLRSIDKAFESEFNQQRVNEFFTLIENRFAAKRGQILKNFQSTQFIEKDDAEIMELSSVDDIVDIHYFFAHPITAMHSMDKRLVEECKTKSHFHVLNKIFPDLYRDTNDAYYMNSLSFLFRLEQDVHDVHWVPSWLSDGGDRNIETVIKRLIKLSLTHFEDDEPRKIILLAASTFRRVFKLLSIIRPEHREIGEFKHLLTRFTDSEFSWRQILSSPTANVIHSIDINTLTATYKFVKLFTDEYSFKTNLARQHLKQLWNIEAKLLASEPNYLELKNELNFGELHPTESASIVYDYLGHSCLCIIDSNKKWKEYALLNHKQDIMRLCSMGSWKAKEIVNQHKLDLDTDVKSINCSDIFFFGDEEIMNTLKTHYWPK